MVTETWRHVKKEETSTKPLRPRSFEPSGLEEIERNYILYKSTSPSITSNPHQSLTLDETSNYARVLQRKISINI